MTQSKVVIWLKAFRLRTLPLALANAVMGSLLALAQDRFRISVFVLTIITITALQILSNLANDYGDYKSGADNESRVGPTRVTVSGMIKIGEIKAMIIAFVVLSFVTGSILIFVGLNNLPWQNIALFYFLGLGAIASAIKYTIGKNPYGYKGFGDVFVFIFFGLVGVIGTYYMHTQQFDPVVVLPAISIGLFSVGVLNVNNLRDIDSDKESGKNTLAVQYGKKFTQFYHLVLLTTAICTAIVFTIAQKNSNWNWIYLISVPLFIRNLTKVFNYDTPDDLNKELKNLALSTFIFALLFGSGLLFS